MFFTNPAFANFLEGSPHKDVLIGMRLNFNPVGTEHLSIPDDFKKAAELGDEDALNYLEYIGEDKK